MSRTVLLIAGKLPDRAAIIDAMTDAHGTPFPIEQVALLAEALERLSRDRTKQTIASDGIAAIIVELPLPDGNGIEAVDRLLEAAAHIPILVIATLQDEDIAKLAVKHGAQDYLLKQRLHGYSLYKAIENMVERAAIAEALFAQNELARITLNSIGDAVLSVNAAGAVTYLNAVAESMTGWRSEEAAGRPLEEVIRITNGVAHVPVPNPLLLAMEQNRAHGLTPDCVLIRRDGSEVSIEDTAAPIHDRSGQVTGAVMVFRDVTQARALALRTIYLAQHDTLCGLANRALLNDRVSHAIKAADRHARKLAVLFVDIDHFKHINDSLGHSIGDRLLQAVAQRLLACVRNSDTVARFGGDEFVVVLSELSQSADAAISADKILLAVGRPYNIDSRSLHITASIGIAACPDDGLDAETLLKNADTAMYQAKETGRNRHCFYEKDMNRLAEERHSLESGLHRAIEQQEFVLHYQPKVNLRTGEITGVESLIRWRHPDHGLVPAAPFIRVAEQSGLIVPIGRWVLGEACRQARAWRDAGLPAIQIGVNASAVELARKEFVDNVRATLFAFDIEPRLLELELTETFLAKEPGKVDVTLRELKLLGVQLAFDDFGTGYASLSCLRRLPVDALKIDQSFVRNITSNANDASIVRAMITMGRSLNLRVVAEGIETKRQLAFLISQACPEGQGYFFSRPVAADECAILLSRRFSVSQKVVPVLDAMVET